MDDSTASPHRVKFESLAPKLSIKFSLVDRAFAPILHSSILILSGALKFHKCCHCILEAASSCKSALD